MRRSRSASHFVVSTPHGQPNVIFPWRSAIACVFLILCFAPGLTFGQRTFTNPLLPAGADPWSFYKDGFYYYTHTLGNRIALWKTRSLADLKAASPKTIWTPPENMPYSHALWAPEIHFITGKWYVYFAADDGKNENHRLYVIENASADPMQGEWILKGKIADSSDRWAIDASVFEHKGHHYLIWSGWEADVNVSQNIYIAKMKNPWTLASERVLISRPEFFWEKHGDIKSGDDTLHVSVNEGPQILKHKGKLFLVYSASGCWTDHYTLGMLMADADSDILKPNSWRKHPTPVFKQSVANGVFAPGHNSFFKSPNGKEDWILYHANAAPGQGCGKDRSPRAERFYWTNDGIPNFGEPAKLGTEMPIPSERKARK